MEEVTGTNNRVLDVNLSSKKVKEFIIAENDRRMFLGGKGLGLKILFDRSKQGWLPPFCISDCPGIKSTSTQPLQGRGKTTVHKAP